MDLKDERTVQVCKKGKKKKPENSQKVVLKCFLIQ